MPAVIRCAWATSTPLLQHYHDHEWGRRPCSPAAWFESLALESLQAGLSWRTVLEKRAALRAAFCHFDPHQVATLSDEHLENCLHNPQLIRHRQKIWSLRTNARVFLSLEAAEGFERFCQHFALSKRTHTSGQTHTPESDALAKALRERGMSFVGPVTALAFMQATGFTCGHHPDCFLFRTC